MDTTWTRPWDEHVSCASRERDARQTMQGLSVITEDDLSMSLFTAGIIPAVSDKGTSKHFLINELINE